MTKIMKPQELCQAIGHHWQGTIHDNFHVCKRCNAVQILRDGKWIQLKGKEKASG